MRDRRCRVCGSVDRLEVHEVQFRSAGGDATDPRNCVLLCDACHRGPTMSVHGFERVRMQPLDVAVGAEGLVKVWVGHESKIV